MSQVENTMVAFRATHTANGTITMTRLGSAATLRERVAGIPAAANIDIGAITSADFTIQDEHGLVAITETTLAANKRYRFSDFLVSGLIGQLSSIVANLSGSGTMVVTIYIRQ